MKIIHKTFWKDQKLLQLLCLGQVEVMYKATFVTFRHFSACRVCELSKCFTIRIFPNTGIKIAVQHDAVNALSILTSFCRTWPSKPNWSWPLVALHFIENKILRYPALKIPQLMKRAEKVATISFSPCTAKNNSLRPTLMMNLSVLIILEHSKQKQGLTLRVRRTQFIGDCLPEKEKIRGEAPFSYDWW